MISSERQADDGEVCPIHDINRDLELPHCLQVVDAVSDRALDGATCAHGTIAAWFENDTAIASDTTRSTFIAP